MPLTKLRILTDRLTGAERRFSLRTLVALSSLPLFGVVAAFGLAPDTNPLDITPQTITEAITLPTLIGSGSEGSFERESLIQSGDTLSIALSRLKIDDLEIQRLLATEAVRQMASSIRSGRRIQATTTQDGQLLTIRFDRGDAPALMINRQGDGFVASESEDVLESRVVMRSGRILSSLYGATDSAGIPDKIANQLAETFSTSMDFREDLRRGDTFSVIYTVSYRNGEPIAAGKLLAAEFVNAGKPHRAILYRDPFGREDYYTPEGESLKRGFLRSPLEFSRVTSSFSNSRKHPVYGFHRAHTGVDFGAPTGTRVKATGDATVAFAGRRGGYGNLVILRHSNGFETYYAHLSAFASGIRAGRPVSQGQVIAYVGSTGASTGPHLHYEIRIAGKPQNPMAIKLPGSPPLVAEQRARFLEQTADWSDKLALLRGTNLAALD
ncbi:MAG: peptidoglycan DD-metalloendopeptidase family protein [Thiobacillus sp.]|uniref:M23 family metallopeptidase n=1 Tax=Thiobacillus sp. TaxID=924 RepID=UPI00273586A2|nr:peptidoglycan DD-metalloendopeptidase family protein [Thiobacillus sp.]MDP3422025.1 peptidoglycan DD-metalloendopeptidase family protein [Thiobacillus sp.]MDP3586130.1 peptidoglycan DD-metalloendopeptidase family protein [Thiobacillus sp.]